MKKFVLLIIILLVAGLLVYKLMSDKNPEPRPPKDEALQIGKNTSVFNAAFSGLMSKYFSMKDALVNWDTAAADQAALLGSLRGHKTAYSAELATLLRGNAALAGRMPKAFRDAIADLRGLA